jgi:hypothetical protein
MSVWVWLLVAALSILTMSALVGLLVAAMLGSISGDVAELLANEPWALAEPTRAKAAVGRE